MSVPPSTAQVGPTPRFWIRTVCVLVSVCLFFFLVVPQSYKDIRKWRFLHVAGEAFKSKNYDQALYFAYTVHQEDLKNKKAVSLISEIYLIIGNPAALRWLSYAAELEPDNPLIQINLGKVALIKGNAALARKCLDRAKTLKNAPPDEMLELEFFVLLREGNAAAAKTLLSARSGDGKTFGNLDLHYAVQLLRSSPGEQKQGIDLLLKMSRQEPVDRSALEQLIRYSLDKQNKELASDSATLLREKKDLSLEHYFLVLQVGLFLDQKLPESFEEEISTRLQSNKKNLAAVLTWLLKNHQEVTADHLIARYMDKQESLSVVQPLYASRLAEKGEWKKLLDTLPDSSWKDMGTFRYMFLLQACRVLKEPGNIGLEKGFYTGLSLELQRSPYTIFAADRMAFNWGWGPERIQLWEILDDADKWPLTHLQAALEAAQRQGNTIQLYGLGRLLNKRSPQNPVAENNLITMALLLDIDPPGQLEKAIKLTERFPAQKILKTTYALALIKNHQPAEALAQYKDFSKAQLQKPQIAAYYAMALLANGQAGKAAPYVALARNASLLPEERALLKQ